MVGYPNTLSTKTDLLNAYRYAKTTGDGKAALRSRLLTIKENTKILVLKKSSASKDSEEITPEDFELVNDPGAEKIRLGITDAEIDELTGGLE